MVREMWRVQFKDREGFEDFVLILSFMKQWIS